MSVYDFLFYTLELSIVRFITPFFMICTGMYLPPILCVIFDLYWVAGACHSHYSFFETSLQEVILYIL